MNLPTPLPSFLSSSLLSFPLGFHFLPLSVFCSQFPELIYIINSFSWFYFNSLWRLFLSFSLDVSSVSLPWLTAMYLFSLPLFLSSLLFPPCLSRSVSASLCHVGQPSSLQQSVKLWWHLNTFITYVTLISDVSLAWCVFAASGGSTKKTVFHLFLRVLQNKKQKGAPLIFHLEISSSCCMMTSVVLDPFEEKFTLIMPSGLSGMGLQSIAL